MHQIIVPTHEVFVRHIDLIKKMNQVRVDIGDMISFLVNAAYYNGFDDFNGVDDFKYFSTIDFADEIILGYINTLGEDVHDLNPHLVVNYDFIYSNMDEVYEFFRDVLVSLLQFKATQLLNVTGGFISGAFFDKLIGYDCLLCVEISVMSTQGPFSVHMV